MNPKTTSKTDRYIHDEFQYGAHNYHPLPVVLNRGEGIYVWDVEGKKYVDFLSAYSAVNQGHSNPAIIKALTEQAQQLSLTSRAFHNDQFGQFAKLATSYFGFDMMLPMNTGAEAVETAIKLARKWGVQKKGISENQAEIVVCQNNFHGRTTTIVSFSSDSVAQKDFGPFTPGFITIPFNDPVALEKVLNERPNIVGFLVEPIQGEAGVNTPGDDFMRKSQELCNTYNVLFMADEIQTGIGRTGSLLAVCGDCSCESSCMQQKDTYARPDVLILGKALGGGVYPVSAVLADRHIMEVIQPGEHGSTFGGNPVASAVGTASLEVIRDKKLAQNARYLGKIFRQHLNDYKIESEVLVGVRGRGLLNAIVINDSQDGSLAWDICMAFKNKGLLAKPTHGNIIRFAPPLVIDEAQLLSCVQIIIETLGEFEPS
ncbi:MAG: ornithine--oxo-acid transaminase [Flavobacteriaceae bacterium]|nr:ornithine--oxo-acid transaminase [Flavobacteriaceae bacterium]